jgi:hypothetical protein
VSGPKRNADPGEFESFLRSIRDLRAYWLSIPGGFGREPKWFAITVCDSCGTLGITSSNRGKGRRWTCPSYGQADRVRGRYAIIECGGFRRPIWSDGLAPEIWVASAEWLSWTDKRSSKSQT